MPICPHCNKESARRKKDACPKCGKEVFIVREGRGKNKRTIWVGNGTSASELVYFLEEHIRRRPGMRHFTFGEPTDKGRHKQIGIAKTLLKWCGYSQEMAIAVIDAYCAGDRRLFPPKTMQGVIGKQFKVALAIAKYNLEEQHSRREADELRAQNSAATLESLRILYGI